MLKTKFTYDLGDGEGPCPVTYTGDGVYWLSGLYGWRKAEDMNDVNFAMRHGREVIWMVRSMLVEVK